MRFACIALCFGLVQFALAEERTAEEWLQAMSKAQRETNFVGTLSYFDGAELTTLKYSHVILDGQVQERVSHLNGPKRELKRDGANVTIEVSQDDELLQMREQFEAGAITTTFQQPFDKLGENYDLEITGTGRIADRTAKCISVVPKEPDRYAIFLWIDEETCLLLRSEMRDEDHRLVNVLQFTDLKTKTVEPSEHAFSGEQTSGVVVDLKGVATKEVPSIEEVGWHTDWVPKGFQRSSSDTEGSFGSDTVRNVMYSDGLVAFSIFVEPAPESLQKAPMESETVSGSTVVVSRRVQHKKGDPSLVTVVGDLPKKTVWRIARGVRFDP